MKLIPRIGSVIKQVEEVTGTRIKYKWIAQQLGLKNPARTTMITRYIQGKSLIPIDKAYHLVHLLNQILDKYEVQMTITVNDLYESIPEQNEIDLT